MSPPLWTPWEQERSTKYLPTSPATAVNKSEKVLAITLGSPGLERPVKRPGSVGCGSALRLPSHPHPQHCLGNITNLPCGVVSAASDTCAAPQDSSPSHSVTRAGSHQGHTRDWGSLMWTVFGSSGPALTLHVSCDLWPKSIHAFSVCPLCRPPSRTCSG